MKYWTLTSILEFLQFKKNLFIVIWSYDMKSKVFKMQLQKVVLGFLWIRNLIWSWNLDGLYVDDGLGTNRSSDTLDSNESVKNTNLMKWILPKIQMVVLERWFFNHWHYSAKEIIFLLFMSNFTSSKQIFSLVFIFFNHFPYHIPNNCLFLCVEKTNERQRTERRLKLFGFCFEQGGRCFQNRMQLTLLQCVP